MISENGFPVLSRINFRGIQSAMPDQIPAEITRLWCNLALQGDHADPVCCAPDWQLAWQKVFHPAGRIFYMADDTSLLLFNICFLHDDRVCLLPLESSWFFAQTLLGCHSIEFLDAALKELGTVFQPRQPIAMLGGMRRQSSATRDMYEYFQDRWNFFVCERTSNMTASLDGGLQGWLSRRSANHRAKLKKAFRKARAAGVTFERCAPQTPEEAAAIYDRMLQVEEKSWKGTGRCGMAEYPVREFYATLLNRFAVRGAARIIFAMLEDRTIGFIFGSVLGVFYRGQQFSYDQEFASFSLGNLMQYETVAWLCEEGMGRYDMGSGMGRAMAYKEHWAELPLPAETWLMLPK